jgi:hypothetical protein
MYGSLKNPAIKRYMWRFSAAIRRISLPRSLGVPARPPDRGYALAVLPSIDCGGRNVPCRGEG